MTSNLKVLGILMALKYWYVIQKIEGYMHYLVIGARYSMKKYFPNFSPCTIYSRRVNVSEMKTIYDKSAENVCYM